MSVIIDHKHPKSVAARRLLGKNRYNGAYFYSVEIGKYFIPTIETDRNWITIRAGEEGIGHSIVFVHDICKYMEKYAYLRKYDDVVYVACLPEIADALSEYGKTILLPLSVDTEYVSKFRCEKDRDVAFVGRTEWRREVEFPGGTDFIEMLPRDELLSEMARYRRVYAESRTAIEARVLGCEVIPYHPNFRDRDLWHVLDSRDAARMLQEELDRIDGR